MKWYLDKSESYLRHTRHKYSKLSDPNSNLTITIIQVPKKPGKSGIQEN